MKELKMNCYGTVIHCCPKEKQTKLKEFFDIDGNLIEQKIKKKKKNYNKLGFEGIKFSIDKQKGVIYI